MSPPKAFSQSIYDVYILQNGNFKVIIRIFIQNNPSNIGTTKQTIISYLHRKRSRVNPICQFFALFRKLKQTNFLYKINRKFESKVDKKIPLCQLQPPVLCPLWTQIVSIDLIKSLFVSVFEIKQKIGRWDLLGTFSYAGMRLLSIQWYQYYQDCSV